jgi:hypothetical protein
VAAAAQLGSFPVGAAHLGSGLWRAPSPAPLLTCSMLPGRTGAAQGARCCRAPPAWLGAAAAAPRVRPMHEGSTRCDAVACAAGGMQLLNHVRRARFLESPPPDRYRTQCYPAATLQLPCSYAATLQLPCSCPAAALQLPCSCPAAALQLPCSYPAATLQLHVTPMYCPTEQIRTRKRTIGLW